MSPDDRCLARVTYFRAGARGQRTQTSPVSCPCGETERVHDQRATKERYFFRDEPRETNKRAAAKRAQGLPGQHQLYKMIEQDDEEATTPLMVVPDEATPLAGGRRRRRLRTGVLATAAAAALMVAAPALDIKKMRRPLAASGAAPTLNRQSLVDPFLKTPHSFKAQNGLKAYSEYGDDDNDHGGDDDDDDDDDYEEYDDDDDESTLAGFGWMGSLEFLVADPVHYIEDHWIWFAPGTALVIILCCLFCFCSPRLAARGGGAAPAGRAPGRPRKGKPRGRGNNA